MLPLITAVEYGQLHVVDYLLGNGADINCQVSIQCNVHDRSRTEILTDHYH